jgi:hypothetical protein
MDLVDVVDLLVLRKWLLTRIPDLEVSFLECSLPFLTGWGAIIILGPSRVNCTIGLRSAQTYAFDLLSPEVLSRAIDFQCEMFLLVLSLTDYCGIIHSVNNEKIVPVGNPIVPVSDLVPSLFEYRNCLLV